MFVLLLFFLEGSSSGFILAVVDSYFTEIDEYKFQPMTK